MPESDLLTQDDPRIGKATELAEYLRQNPKASKRDPEELARQFGVSASLAAQLASSRFLTSDPEPKENSAKLKDAAQYLGRLLTKTVETITANPYLFFLIAFVVFSLVLLLPHSKPTGRVAAGFWFGAQAFYFYFQPKFRYVVFSAALSAITLTGFFAELLPHSPAPLDTTLGHLSFSLFAAISVAAFSIAPMSVFMLLGGARIVRQSRKREAAKSRHDLLSRMFQLQEQLNVLPHKVAKKPNPILAALRLRPLVSSLCIGLVLGLGRAIQLGVFPKEALRQMANTSAHPSSKVQVTVATISPAFLTLSLAMLVLSFGGPILLGVVSTTPRKLSIVCAALIFAEAVGIMFFWPFGAYTAIPRYMVWAQIASDSATRVITILLTRFGLLFHRSLKTLSKDYEGDESDIVSELLEIRHRLSANPTLVYVLVVDAAGSTKMKEGEDPLLVEYSFRSYQAWIAGVIGREGGSVDAMTGDGAICAFGTAVAAYKAAQEIQAGIASMNKEGNRLTLPFRLRIALHAGSVVADLDKVQFTNVIDVAAHVEKYSPIGGIAMTDPFLLALTDLPTHEKAATVDGIGVYAIGAAALPKKVTETGP